MTSSKRSAITSSPVLEPLGDRRREDVEQEPLGPVLLGLERSVRPFTLRTKYASITYALSVTPTIFKTKNAVTIASGSEAGSCAKRGSSSASNISSTM